jgi:HEAT repeat protein
MGHIRDGGTTSTRSAMLILLLGTSLLGTSLLGAGGCHTRVAKSITHSGAAPSGPLPQIVHLPVSAQELTARLHVNEPMLRVDRAGAANGWRMDPEGSADGGWRWRHQRVETLREDLREASPQQRQALLLLADSADDPTVGANAIIALAREGNRDAMGRLFPLVENHRLPTTIRCAALESVALANGQQILPRLREIIDSGLAPVNKPARPFDETLLAEGLRNLSVYQSVDEDRRFGVALSHRSPTVQLAALEAWEAPGLVAPPKQITLLFHSPEPRVRSAALRVLSVRPVLGIYAEITPLMMDPNYTVQQAAAAAMLATDGQTAIADLKRYTKSGSELVRASIAAAFAQYGYYDMTYRMTDDSSWRVRQAIAAAVASDTRPQAEEVATKLVVDRSPQVQASVISAVGSWPVERGGRILLTAMSSTAYATREAARVALAQDWPAAETFSSGAPPNQRKETLAKFEQQFAQNYKLTVAPEQDVFEPSDAIRQLTKAEMSQRNAAVNDLVLSIQRHELTERQASDLAKELSTWGTSTPWASVIKAMDGLDSGRNVILSLALSGEHAPAIHAACDHLAKFPSFGATQHPEPIIVQLENISRSNDHVAAGKAIRALAATGDPGQAERIASFLSAGDRQLRIAAGMGLVKLKDQRGRRALERLASEPSLQVRRLLLEQLAADPDPQLAYLLVRLLDDRPDVGRGALSTLEQWSNSGMLPSLPSNATAFADRRAGWQAFAQNGFASLPPQWSMEPAPGGVQPAGFNQPDLGPPTARQSPPNQLPLR